jgi:hypothetical protein
LFGVATLFLLGQAGPCASPLILIFPLSLIGAIVGVVLSIVRTGRHIHQQDTAKDEAK